MKNVLVAAILIWLATIVLVVFVSGFFPAKYFFPYRDVLLSYVAPNWSGFGNFDGVHYLMIAKEGYKGYQQAFFPLYPLLIKLTAFLFGGNYFISGLVLSWLSYFLGVIIWFKVFQKLGLSQAKAKRTVALWLVFPTSYYFLSIYTESLFFLLLGLCLYLLLTGRFWQLFVSEVLLSLARVVGVFFPIIVFFNSKLDWKKKIFLSLGSVLGVGLYSFYLVKETGDPFYFVTAQKFFNNRQVDSWVFLPQVYYRYLKIFTTADFSFAYFVAVLECLFFSLAFFVLVFYGIKKRFYYFYKDFSVEKGLFYYSFFVLLLPTLTGFFYSVPRFVLLIPSFMIYLADLLSKNSFVFKLAVVLFLILYALLTIAFANGYFVA